MKRTVAAVLVVTLAAPSVLLAKVNSERAAYFGGSVAMFAGAKDPVEGKLDTVNEEMLILRADKKPYVGQELRIPYKRIQDLEYGQKAGRRVGAAVGYTVLLGPLGLLTLFSKKRNHYLTVAWKDDADKEQVAAERTGLAGLPTWSGACWILSSGPLHRPFYNRVGLMALQPGSGLSASLQR